MTSDEYDFGFTAVDEPNLANIEADQKRIAELLGAIQPLLDNLKKNPEKDYIFWPDRIKKIEAFEKKLANIIVD